MKTHPTTRAKDIGNVGFTPEWTSVHDYADGDPPDRFVLDLDGVSHRINVAQANWLLRALLKHAGAPRIPG